MSLNSRFNVCPLVIGLQQLATHPPTHHSVILNWNTLGPIFFGAIFLLFSSDIWKDPEISKDFVNLVFGIHNYKIH